MTERIPSIAGVILAAGASSRMGQDKALLPWHGETLLGATIEMLKPVAEFWIVVAGANFKNLAPVVYGRGGFIVENPEPGAGQFSSLRVGMQAVLNRGRDAAVIALVDRPPALPATIAELHKTFISALGRDKWALIPEHGGQHGHPIFVGREMIEAFLRADPASTARDVEHAHLDRIEYHTVSDANVIMNINTPADYSAIEGS